MSEPRTVDMMAVARRQAARGDFEGALFSAGRNYGPRLFFKWFAKGFLRRTELRKLLPGVWTGAEWPERAAPTALWISVFKKAGFVSDTRGVLKPAKRLTIYRGCTAERQLGMAWTMRQTTAAWFANRDREDFRLPQATIFTAQILPLGILAVIKDRDEAEVVVDPSKLKNIAELRVSTAQFTQLCESERQARSERDRLESYGSLTQGRKGQVLRSE